MRLAAICFVLLLPTVAISGQREKKAFAAFEHYCLQGMARPDQIPKMLQSVGAKAMHPMAATHYLKQAGRVWLVKTGSLEFRVFLTDTGACGTKFSFLDFNAAKALFEKRTLNKLSEHSEDSTQVLRIYATRFPGQNGADDTFLAAMLLGGKLGANRDTMVMSTIPKAAIEELGMLLQWP